MVETLNSSFFLIVAPLLLVMNCLVDAKAFTLQGKKKGLKNKHPRKNLEQLKSQCVKKAAQGHV